MSDDRIRKPLDAVGRVTTVRGRFEQLEDDPQELRAQVHILQAVHEHITDSNGLAAAITRAADEMLGWVPADRRKLAYYGFIFALLGRPPEGAR